MVYGGGAPGVVEEDPGDTSGPSQGPVALAQVEEKPQIHTEQTHTAVCQRQRHQEVVVRDLNETKRHQNESL